MNVTNRHIILQTIGNASLNICLYIYDENREMLRENLRFFQLSLFLTKIKPLFCQL